MRINTLLKHEFTFEYWRPTYVPDAIDPQSVDIEYDLEGTFKGSLMPRAGGTMTMISDKQLDVDGEVRHITDPTGTEIFVVRGVPYNHFVTRVEPIFGAFGELQGWRNHLERAA